MEDTKRREGIEGLVRDGRRRTVSFTETTVFDNGDVIEIVTAPMESTTVFTGRLNAKDCVKITISGHRSGPEHNIVEIDGKVVDFKEAPKRGILLHGTLVEAFVNYHNERADALKLRDARDLLLKTVLFYSEPLVVKRVFDELVRDDPIKSVLAGVKKEADYDADSPRD